MKATGMSTSTSTSSSIRHDSVSNSTRQALKYNVFNAAHAFDDVSLTKLIVLTFLRMKYVFHVFLRCDMRVGVRMAFALGVYK